LNRILRVLLLNRVTLVTGLFGPGPGPVSQRRDTPESAPPLTGTVTEKFRVGSKSD